jgi:RNA polymerase sigma-70 factor (ECF subfamily)
MGSGHYTSAVDSTPSPEVVARLVAGHREFLRFLEGRVRDRAVAEELLQNAFVRTMEKGGSIEDDESAVAWFYRLLRNSLTDHYRRRATESKALEREAAEPRAICELEMKGAICECMNTLLPTLKPEYAEILQRVDLQDSALTEVASELGISQNNATVRLHRARQALKRQLEQSCGTCATHGCLDCTCGSAAGCGHQ